MFFAKHEYSPNAACPEEGILATINQLSWKGVPKPLLSPGIRDLENLGVLVPTAHTEHKSACLANACIYQPFVGTSVRHLPNTS